MLLFLTSILTVRTMAFKQANILRWLRMTPLETPVEPKNMTGLQIAPLQSDQIDWSDLGDLIQLSFT